MTTVIVPAEEAPVEVTPPPSPPKGGETGENEDDSKTTVVERARFRLGPAASALIVSGQLRSRIGRGKTSCSAQVCTIKDDDGGR